MKLQKKIEVWLVKKRLPQPIDLVQYNTGIQLVFALQDFEIPSGTTATMYVQKPSGKFVFQETDITVASDAITVDLHNQAITECGNEVNYQLQLKNGTDLLTTFTGIFRVEKSLANDGAMRSETVVAAFEAKTAEQLEKIQAEATAQIALVKSESTKQQTAIRDLSQTEQAAIADKGLETLNTIPADYTALSALADKNSREKSPAIVCEASGEIITLSDASDNFVRGLKLYGKTTQVTTEGYQLFDASKLGTKTAGGCTVTNNGDGSLAISGSGTLSETFAISCDYTHEESVALLQEGTLHLAVGTTTPQVMVYLARHSGTTVLDNSNTTAEITQEMLIDTTFFIRLSVYGASGRTIQTGTVKPMLYQNGDGTFEPYTGGKPSPSPEYPQELTSTGDGGSVTTMVGISIEDTAPQSITTQTPNGLCGIPVASVGNYTDENGQQWVCDEVDFARGVYVQRVKKRVFDGTESWTAGTQGSHVIALKGMFRDTGYSARVIVRSNYYRAIPYSNELIAGTISNFIGTLGDVIRIVDKTVSTVEAWSEHLAALYAAGTPVTVQYILATPIETPLSAEEIAAFKALHTNKPNTTVYNDAGAHMEMAYNADTKLYIDNKFAELAAAIVNGNE